MKYLFLTLTKSPGWLFLLGQETLEFGLPHSGNCSRKRKKREKFLYICLSLCSPLFHSHTQSLSNSSFQPSNYSSNINTGCFGLLTRHHKSLHSTCSYSTLTLTTSSRCTAIRSHNIIQWTITHDH